jgi:hypothetical protein
MTVTALKAIQSMKVGMKAALYEWNVVHCYGQRKIQFNFVDLPVIQDPNNGDNWVVKHAKIVGQKIRLRCAFWGLKVQNDEFDLDAVKEGVPAFVGPESDSSVIVKDNIVIVKQQSASYEYGASDAEIVGSVTSVHADYAELRPFFVDGLPILGDRNGKNPLVFHIRFRCWEEVEIWSYMSYNLKVLPIHATIDVLNGASLIDDKTKGSLTLVKRTTDVARASGKSILLEYSGTSFAPNSQGVNGKHDLVLATSDSAVYNAVSDKNQKHALNHTLWFAQLWTFLAQYDCISKYSPGKNHKTLTDYLRDLARERVSDNWTEAGRSLTISWERLMKALENVGINQEAFPKPLGLAGPPVAHADLETTLAQFSGVSVPKPPPPSSKPGPNPTPPPTPPPGPKPGPNPNPPPPAVPSTPGTGPPPHVHRPPHVPSHVPVGPRRKPGVTDKEYLRAGKAKVADLMDSIETLRSKRTKKNARHTDSEVARIHEEITLLMEEMENVVLSAAGIESDSPFSGDNYRFKLLNDPKITDNFLNWTTKRGYKGLKNIDIKYPQWVGNIDKRSYLIDIRFYAEGETHPCVRFSYTRFRPFLIPINIKGGTVPQFIVAIGNNGKHANSDPDPGMSELMLDSAMDMPRSGTVRLMINASLTVGTYDLVETAIEEDYAVLLINMWNRDDIHEPLFLILKNEREEKKLSLNSLIWTAHSLRENPKV